MFGNMKMRKALTGGLTAALVATGFVALPGVFSSTAEAQSFHWGYGYGSHRHWGGHRHWYRHRDWHHGGVAAAGILGLATGATLGSTVSQPYYGYYGRPAYGYYQPRYYQPRYYQRHYDVSRPNYRYYGGYHDGTYTAVRSGSQLNGGKSNDDPSQPIINY